MALDESRKSTGVLLPPEISNEIWAKTLEESAIMKLARQISLPGSGVSVPIIVGDSVAEFVGETDAVPVSHASFASKTLTPYKVSVIDTFSNEFKRDEDGLFNELLRRLPFALGSRFDAAVTGAKSAPTGNFDTLKDATKIAIDANTYDALVTADELVADNNSEITGWALTPQARGVLLKAKDAEGRPLIINNVQTDGSVPALLGKPVHYAKSLYIKGDETANVIGVAGDWTNAVFGTVAGINVAITDSATIYDGTTNINLFQRDMFAVKTTIEVGFAIRDIKDFVLLTDTYEE
jgi:HK97 family phage major capsid protein